MFNFEMFVCVCNAVTERDVHEAIEAGASTVEEVAYCTGAGTRCGTCVSVVAAMLERAEEKPSRRSLPVLITAA